MRTPELDTVRQVLKTPLPVEERAKLLAAARKAPDVSRKLDECLLAEMARVEREVGAVVHEQERLRKALAGMTQPPLFPATFLGSVPQGLMVLMPGGGKRVVTCSTDCDTSNLRPGNDVLLNPDLNLVVGVVESSRNGGDVGTFDRLLGSRMILRHREEEFVVEPLTPLDELLDTLEAGDLVRFDRAAMLAFERLPRSKHDRFLTKDPPKATFADIGGLDREIEDIKRRLMLRFFHPEKAAAYGLDSASALLLEGPPGNGKTMVAGALAHWLGEISGRPAVWISVKPGELRSEWHGVTERNLRECFEAARVAGRGDERVPVILFFDEVDSIGTTRGRSSFHIDDRVMQAFAAELDGVSARGNLFVIGATNRRHALDPALLRPGRFGDKTILVPRPRIQAARAILNLHLNGGLPVYLNGHSGVDSARRALLDGVLSRLFAPNAMPPLVNLGLRDGTVRPVRAAELISGANLANIVRNARESACWRDVQDGVPGLRLSDLWDALDRELEGLQRLLTPQNARDHILDLPDDIDVVKVERPKESRTAAPHRYLNLH